MDDTRPRGPADGADTLVEWRAWGPAPFEEARAADRPLVLFLTTPWCTSCVEMDREVWDDPGVAANVHDGFVPVRVDADRRPDVRERYQPGGFPATVFLTPDGEVLAGTTRPNLEGLRSVLARVRETYAERPDAGRTPRAVRERPPAGDPIGAVAAMREQVETAFDAEFGGWGTETKFPLPRTVAFALTRVPGAATRTLEAIRTHLYDTYDGGFYRYALGRDWSEPRREKLAADNAALVCTFAAAYLVTGEDAYRDPAAGTVDYLSTTLWTGSAFAGSQAGGDYFQLAPDEREVADPPAVDSTVFAGTNGLAADACLRFSAVTDREDAARVAERALEHVLDGLVDGGRVAHYEGGPTGLLGDQARLLAGLTTAGQVLGGHRDAARAVADWTLEQLADDDGALRDRPAEAAPGLLDRPLYPLDPAVDCADALVDLAVLTGEDRYREAARRALSAFGGATDRAGPAVAGYATAVARAFGEAGADADGPLVIRVADTPGSALHRAALRMADHEKVVVPDADGDGGTATVDGVADVAETPAALEALVRTARE
jgi:uncharacterized protein YyaL (SSP411 family)